MLKLGLGEKGGIHEEYDKHPKGSGHITESRVWNNCQENNLEVFLADEHLLSFMMLGFDVGGFEACQPPGYLVPGA